MPRSTRASRRRPRAWANVRTGRRGGAGAAARAPFAVLVRAFAARAVRAGATAFGGGVAARRGAGAARRGGHAPRRRASRARAGRSRGGSTRARGPKTFDGRCCVVVFAWLAGVGERVAAPGAWLWCTLRQGASPSRAFENARGVEGAGVTRAGGCQSALSGDDGRRHMRPIIRVRPRRFWGSRPKTIEAARHDWRTAPLRLRVNPAAAARRCLLPPAAGARGALRDERENAAGRRGRRATGDVLLYARRGRPRHLRAVARPRAAMAMQPTEGAQSA